MFKSLLPMLMFLNKSAEQWKERMGPNDVLDAVFL